MGNLSGKLNCSCCGEKEKNNNKSDVIIVNPSSSENNESSPLLQNDNNGKSDYNGESSSNLPPEEADASIVERNNNKDLKKSIEQRSNKTDHLNEVNIRYSKDDNKAPLSTQDESDIELSSESSINVTTTQPQSKLIKHNESLLYQQDTTETANKKNVTPTTIAEEKHFQTKLVAEETQIITLDLPTTIAEKEHIQNITSVAGEEHNIEINNDEIEKREIETLKKLDKIAEATILIQENLETFTGSKLEDAYYTIDNDIESNMISIDNLKTLNRPKIKAKRKEVHNKLQVLAEIYDEKCANAPPTLTIEEREEKFAIFKGIRGEVKIVDKLMEDSNVDTTEVDNKLLDLFTRTNNVDANKDDDVEKEKTKLIKLIQDSMLQLSYLIDRKKF